MTSILHITPHLGGGVGKALSTLLKISTVYGKNKHTVICLEKPVKSKYYEEIILNGVEIIIEDDINKFINLLSNTEIVQIEYWNHPLIIRFLTQISNIPIRVVFWSHVSGINNPINNIKLIKSVNKFIFTSNCSFESKEIKDLDPQFKKNITTISSASGNENLPLTNAKKCKELLVGYIGSLNYAKLNPNYLDYILAVKNQNFKIKMIGDINNNLLLIDQKRLSPDKDILEFIGYIDNIIDELKNVNVLAYILNPTHYGTAENALVETMTMGIVPIVLNNLAETEIVSHMETGIVVKNPYEFSSAINLLSTNYELRNRISDNASRDVRIKYNSNLIYKKFDLIYNEVSKESKRIINFFDLYGNEVDKWFLSFQRNPEIFKYDGEVNIENNSNEFFALIDDSKGSPSQFLKYYPENVFLKLWNNSLTSKN